MQVKKFEANSMKEALEMVKANLGPDAIILSAKGNSRNGLLGKNSVEVTAAVSEATLQKKKLAESKMRDQDKKRFQTAPAKQQRVVINSVIEEFERVRDEERAEAVVRKKPTTTMPYVDIVDEADGVRAESIGKNVKTLLNRMMLEDEHSSSDDIIDQHSKRLRRAQENAIADAQIQGLTSEILRLKKVIEDQKATPANAITLHPGASWGIPFELSAIFEKLMLAGISEGNAVELVQTAQKNISNAQIRDKALVEAWMYKYLLDSIRVSEDHLRGRIHLFVGAGGQGKTSSLIRFASYLTIAKKRSVAILTADNFKIGATEQLKILTKILHVPFGVIKSSSDWDLQLKKLKDVDLILVDFPGLSLKNPQELELIKQYMPPKGVVTTCHYVQSAICRDIDAFEMARRYQALNFDDVIFTSVDESYQHGIFYNFQKKFNVPIHSLGIGPKLPEDYEIAIKERLLDLMFNITKQG